MAWKVFWDAPCGDGTLPSSFASRAVRSDLDRLFYTEGALTIFTALVAVFVPPGLPSTFHRWLSPVEVRLAEKRMEEDAGIGDEGQTEVKSRRQIFVSALTDWKVIYTAMRYVILRTPRERV